MEQNQNNPETTKDFGISDISLVIGRRGSGKTILTKRYVLPSIPAPFIIYDQLYEYGDLPIPMLSDWNSIYDYMENGTSFRVNPETIGYNRLIQVIRKIQGYTLVTDEFHLLYKHHMNFDKDFPEFKKLVLTGRHTNNGLVIISQRPTDMPRFLLAQATRVFTYHVYFDDDIKFMKQIVNDPERFQSLGEFEFDEIFLGSPITITRKKLKI